MLGEAIQIEIGRSDFWLTKLCVTLKFWQIIEFVHITCF